MKLLGCFAARKMWLALSMPTMSSVGEWKTSSALCKPARWPVRFCWATSSRKLRRTRNGRPGERYFDFALRLDFGGAAAEQAGDMRGIERCVDRHYGARLGDAVRRREHGGAAEAVADQDRRRGQRLPQMIGGGDEIIDIG